jgi:hypothetical protein
VSGAQSIRCDPTPIRNGCLPCHIDVYTNLNAIHSSLRIRKNKGLVDQQAATPNHYGATTDATGVKECIDESNPA